MAAVASVHARQILDSRGNPTVEVDLTLKDGSFGRAAVPSGASTGSREALELRDGGSQYMGKSTMQAVNNVNTTLRSLVVGKDWTQQSLDQAMIEADGTEFKSKLGANAILGVSLAFAVAVAQSNKQPVYEYIASLHGGAKPIMPRPMLNIMNGGAHADWATDIQEYMILPMGDLPYAEKLRKSVEVFHHLGKILKSKGYSTNVGNEGGYAPAIGSNAEAFDLILEAIAKAGYTVGADKDFMLGIDAAASEFYKDGRYHLKRDNSVKSPDEMIDWLVDLTERYPLLSLEDPLAEGDWEGWQKLTARLGATHQIVGDDLLVTNPKFVAQAIEQKSCNAVLIKLNQIGTLTETLQAIKMTQDTGWNAVCSHRSGETEDVFLSHLVVGTASGQIKTGAPSRTDRTAKYNELLRIAEQVEK
jgi:enolase